MNSGDHEITDLLRRWAAGDHEAYDMLMALAYAEIKRMAGGLLARQSRDLRLSPSSLIHEAYLKLIGHQVAMPWRDRRDFFALLTHAMMSILVDFARRRNAQKRGGDQIFMTLDEDQIGNSNGVDVLSLNQVLERLQKLDPRRANIWKCRYLGGLSIAELAEIFQLGNAFLHRELKAANGWLRGQLTLAPT